MYHDAKFERRRDARLTVDDLKDVTVDSFIEIAKDKWKSRSLQRSLMESDEVMSDNVLSDSNDRIRNLVVGSFVISLTLTLFWLPFR